MDEARSPEFWIDPAGSLSLIEPIINLSFCAIVTSDKQICLYMLSQHQFWIIYLKKFQYAKFC